MILPVRRSLQTQSQPLQVASEVGFPNGRVAGLVFQASPVGEQEGVIRSQGESPVAEISRATPVPAGDPVPLIRGAGEHQPEPVLNLLSRGKPVDCVAMPAAEGASGYERFLRQVVRCRDTQEVWDSLADFQGLQAPLETLLEVLLLTFDERCQQQRPRLELGVTV